MASRRFCPAGLESDSDDEYDDGFYFSSESSNRNNNESNTFHQQPLSKKPEGFGTAVNKQNKRTETWIPNSRQQPKQRSQQPVMMKKRKEAVCVDDFKNAITRGHVEQLEQFIEEGFAVDKILHAGWSGLMYAGNWANPEIVKTLLKHGAKPNFHCNRYSALMATCCSTRSNEASLLECVKLLVDGGAEINEYDRFHMSPVMYAAREGRPLITSYLIKVGANLAKQDSRGFSALMWASSKGHVRVVQVLLEGGADPAQASADGSTASDVAFTQGHQKVVDLLKAFSRGGSEAVKSSRVVNQLTENEERAADEDEINIQYGDLEMFLCGLQLSELIPVFQDHKITFQTFLKMTDADLQQVGVKQLGTRKKILDSIYETHKKDWEVTSLPSLQYNKPITCPETLAMISNISKHAEYITSTLFYINSQIKQQPEVLKSNQEGATVTELDGKTQEAMDNIRSLYSQLTILGTRIAQQTSKENYLPADLIKYKKKSKKSRKRVFILIGALSVVSIVTWKQEQITDFCIKTVNTLTSRQQL